MAGPLRGDINDTWDFDIWATYTEGEEEELQRNDGSFSRFQQGLLVDDLVPDRPVRIHIG